MEPSERQRGQGLVEFAMVVPVFMLFLLGLLELGFAFDHVMTLSYASREGARTGAALADGSKLAVCGDVDKYVISAVERVLTSEGSSIRDQLGRVSQIRIFKALAPSGAQDGTKVNVWIPGAGPTVDGRQLHFVLSSSGWAQCSRSNTTAHPDSIGVSIAYSYAAVTPLAGIMDFFGGGGWSSLPMSDRTVMALNPTD
ncbi:MAG: TadE family protein [Candidatus Limnocylindrales bacterium]